MGDSSCLIHGFSYASAIPNQSKQGNPMHVLGESISFGRFITEPLSWDKWSTFPHKKYVEEAARFAQPGSVAAKKAFFEAHYKRIAAQKAAALLDQQNATKKESKGDDDGSANDKKKIVILNSEFDADEKMEVAKIQDDVVNGNEGLGSVNLSENQDTVSCSEGSGTPQMERPLLKNSAATEDISSVMIKKKSGLSSLKSSIRRKTWRVPSTPSKPVTPHLKKETNVTQSTRKSTVDPMDKKRSSPKSRRGLINLTPIKEPDKQPILAIKNHVASSGLPPTSSRATTNCKTPLRTPMAAKKTEAKYRASTPQSENRRMKTPIDPSSPGTKTGGPKWHILSAVYSKSVSACRNKLQTPTSSTPFVLRTEERAAKRKQKLEEKFKANEVSKEQLQKTLKEKAGKEFRKLSYSLCFKARPLPDFYKERDTPINQMKKSIVQTSATRPQTVVLGRSTSDKKQSGTVSMPPPPPPLTKNGLSKNLSKKSNAKPRKNLTTLPERITHENKSPNIQH